MRLTFILLFFLSTAWAEMTPINSDGYKMVWNDEFNIDGKLSDEWDYETGFVRNWELQWYQKDNAYCKDGLLVIEGRKEKHNNPGYKANGDWRQERKHYYYTSASVLTKKSWKYGRFEIKARFAPKGGLWPAIWTLGKKGEWPSNGEIDIMEFYAGSIKANFAWGSKKRWTPQWNTVKVPLKDPAHNEKFHIWRMDWTSESVKIYMNGKLINSQDLSNTVNLNNRGPKNPFQQAHYLILNLAMGGLAGDPNKVEFPTKFEIDYVRIYQKGSKDSLSNLSK